MTVVTVGEQIKKIRLQKGMTQRQVANACGIADSAIRKYESGIMRPKPLMVSRIAKALDVEPLLLTRWDPHYPISFTVSTDELENAVNALFRGGDIYKRVSKTLDLLNDDGQQKVANYAEDLTKIPEYRRTDAPPPSPEDSDTTGSD